MINPDHIEITKKQKKYLTEYSAELSLVATAGVNPHIYHNNYDLDGETRKMLLNKVWEEIYEVQAFRNKLCGVKAAALDLRAAMDARMLPDMWDKFCEALDVLWNFYTIDSARKRAVEAVAAAKELAAKEAEARDGARWWENWPKSWSSADMVVVDDGAFLPDNEPPADPNIIPAEPGDIPHEEDVPW